MGRVDRGGLRAEAGTARRRRRRTARPRTRNPRCGLNGLGFCRWPVLPMTARADRLTPVLPGRLPMVHVGSDTGAGSFEASIVAWNVPAIASRRASPARLVAGGRRTAIPLIRAESRQGRHERQAEIEAGVARRDGPPHQGGAGAQIGDDPEGRWPARGKCGKCGAPNRVKIPVGQSPSTARARNAATSSGE